MLIRNITRLSNSQLGMVSMNGSSLSDKSLFGFLKKASSELSSVAQPTDLESLVRLVSAIDSFKYPAFAPALKEIASHGGDAGWMNKIRDEVQSCDHKNAIRYLKGLRGSYGIPRDVLSQLFGKIRIESDRDVEDICGVIASLDYELARSSAVLNVVKDIITSCLTDQRWSLRLLLKLWDVDTHFYRTCGKPWLPATTRDNLTKGTWSTFAKAGIESENGIVNAIRWLCLAQTGPDMKLEAQFNQLEMLVRSIEISNSGLSVILSSILGMRREGSYLFKSVVLPEPLDTISQIVLSRFQVAKAASSKGISPISFNMTTMETLMPLVDAVNVFLLRKSHHTWPQQQQIVDTLLPQLTPFVKTAVAMPNIPTRYLSGLLRMTMLVESLGAENSTKMIVGHLLERGHEMDGVELVKLINDLDMTCFNEESANMSRSLIPALFRCDQEDPSTKLMEDLLSRLPLSGRLEFLSQIIIADVHSAPELSVLFPKLVESIRLELKRRQVMRKDAFGESIGTAILDQAELSARAISRVYEASRIGASVFADISQVSASALMASFLESKRLSKLSVAEQIGMAKSARGDLSTQKIIFDNILENDLTAWECADLLKVVESNPSLAKTALRKLIPRIAQVNNNIVGLLKVLPESFASLTDSEVNAYEPRNQLKEAILDALIASYSKLSGKHTLAESVDVLRQLGRLNYYSQEAVQSLVSSITKLSSGNTVSTIPLGGGGLSYGVDILDSLRKLRVYSEPLIEAVTKGFVAEYGKSPDATLLASFGQLSLSLGHKPNQRFIDLVDEVLKRETSGLRTKISLLNVLARSGVFSPIFMEEIKSIVALGTEGSSIATALSDADWLRFYQINLSIFIDSPPKLKSRFAHDSLFKQFVDDFCSFTWYANQEKLRNKFVHSVERDQVTEAANSLAWTIKVPDFAKEVYHVEFVSSGAENSSTDKIAIVLIPTEDELRYFETKTGGSSSTKVIIGDSLQRVKHLQMFGYKVVPVWESAWRKTQTLEERKKLLIDASSQTVFATACN